MYLFFCVFLFLCSYCCSCVLVFFVLAYLLLCSCGRFLVPVFFLCSCSHVLVFFLLLLLFLSSAFLCCSCSRSFWFWVLVFLHAFVPKFFFYCCCSCVRVFMFSSSCSRAFVFLVFLSSCLGLVLATGRRVVLVQSEVRLPARDVPGGAGHIRLSRGHQGDAAPHTTLRKTFSDMVY